MALSFIKKVFTFGKPLEEAKPQEAVPAIEPVKEELPVAADPVLPGEVETAGGPVADVAEPEVVEEAEEPAILPDVAQMSDVGVVPLSLLEAEAEAEATVEEPAAIHTETPPSVPTEHLPHKGGDQVEDAVPDREEGRVEPTETFPEEILPKEDESLLDAEVAQDLPAQPISPPVGEMPGRAEGGIPPADIEEAQAEQVSDAEDASPEQAPILPKGFATGAAVPEPEPVVIQPKLSWFQRLRAGLARTSSQLTGQITALFTKRKLDDETLQDLEDLLIQADLGVETAHVGFRIRDVGA